MDNSFTDLPIEDLGDFLNDQFNAHTGNWQGFSLGYAEDEVAESASRPRLNSFANAFSLSPPLLPLRNDKMKVDETTEEFSAFHIDDSFVSLQSASESTESISKTTKPANGIEKSLRTKSRIDRKTKDSNAVATSAVQSHASVGVVSSSKRRRESSEVCGPIRQAEIDRGVRKKSREKMRRLEVNVKFEELIELLGLSTKVRKSSILQEAVSCIKNLRRERDELRKDRERMQQEMSKLATCLQYSHMGSNSMGLVVPPIPPQLSIPHMACTPAAACFPINQSASIKPARGQIAPVIAPKTETSNSSQASVFSVSSTTSPLAWPLSSSIAPAMSSVSSNTTK